MNNFIMAVKARALSEARSDPNVLAAPPPRNVKFTYHPMLAFYAVLEEERSGVLIKTPHEIAGMDMDWREDLATVRERLRFERDWLKYPADMRS